VHQRKWPFRQITLIIWPMAEPPPVAWRICRCDYHPDAIIFKMSRNHQDLPPAFAQAAIFRSA